MSVLLHEPEPSLPGCLHEVTGWLGSEGTATFYACDACGSVVIVQASHRWVLRRTLPP